LAANAARNAGTARCELCAAVAASGAPLNCDHVVPLSKDWSRRLDPANLQILCQACNFGKSNRDAIDWRPTDPPDGQPASAITCKDMHLYALLYRDVHREHRGVVA
jgi:5-methylcytosine-specific restriction endonuclease McrA